MTDPKVLATSTFRAQLKRESSWGEQSLGQHESTMTLYEWPNQRGYLMIEWDIPALEESEQIGLWFDHRGRLTDYDGVLSLPREAVHLIRKAGFAVPREFE